MQVERASLVDYPSHIFTCVILRPAAESYKKEINKAIEHNRGRTLDGSPKSLKINGDYRRSAPDDVTETVDGAKLERMAGKPINETPSGFRVSEMHVAPAVNQIFN